MRSERAKQQVSCYTTSGSASLSFHLRALRFLWIYSLAIFFYIFYSIHILTPRYFTMFVHLIPFISYSFCEVSISDFFLFSRRLCFIWREVIPFMASSISLF